MPKNRDQLNTWLMELARGQIRQEHRQQLEKQMLADPEVLAYCQDFFITCAGLEEVMRAHSLADLNLIPPQHTRKRLFRKRFLGWACGAAALILITFAVGLLWWPRPPLDAGPMAVLTNRYDLKWAASSDPGQTTQFFKADSLKILEGFAEFKMAHGTTVLLKGPCQFTLIDPNHIQLDRGMLSVKVPWFDHGFEVKTRHARIVDLGTEFGVLAQDDGRVETQVLMGHADVHANQSQHILHLSAGKRALVDANGHIQPFSPTTAGTYFVQRLPHATPACPGRRLDLADIVGGGNGFGFGVLGQGLEPDQGNILQDSTYQTRSFAKSRFTPIPANRYIDGLFLPDGSHGPVIISHTHLIFEGCPATQGDYYEGVFNGVTLHAADMPNKVFQGRLKGTTYGTTQRPGLNCHPNIGITFDLDHIRQDNPGVSIQSFTALCGINDITPVPRHSNVDFWVLIDGKVRFTHRCGIKNQDVSSIAIPISEHDRFLSLATTADNDIAYCWSFFAEPSLILTTQP